MDMEGFAWETCPRGETMGATGLYIATRDMAKLGVLYLHNGMWKGKRLLSAEWTAQAICRQTPYAAYGFGFLVGDKGFEMNGAHQQTVTVLPKENIVLAAHAFADKYDYLALLRRAELII